MVTMKVYEIWSLDEEEFNKIVKDRGEDKGMVWQSIDNTATQMYSWSPDQVITTIEELRELRKNLARTKWIGRISIEVADTGEWYDITSNEDVNVVDELEEYFKG